MPLACAVPWEVGSHWANVVKIRTSDLKLNAHPVPRPDLSSRDQLGLDGELIAPALVLSVVTL